MGSEMCIRDSAPIEEEIKQSVVPEEPLTEPAIAIETTTLAEPKEIIDTTEPVSH